jgi:hypothetical protein
MAFTKVLTICQIYHTWFPSLLLLFFLPSFFGSFNEYHFCIYIHVYTVYWLKKILMTDNFFWAIFKNFWLIDLAVTFLLHSWKLPITFVYRTKKNRWYNRPTTINLIFSQVFCLKGQQNLHNPKSHVAWKYFMIVYVCCVFTLFLILENIIWDFSV